MELELYKVKKDICILSHDNEMLEVPKGSLVQPADSQHYEIMVLNKAFRIVKIKKSIISNTEIFEKISSVEYYQSLAIYDFVGIIRDQELDPIETIRKVAKAFNLDPVFIQKMEPIEPISGDLFTKCSCSLGGVCNRTGCPNQIVYQYTTSDPNTFFGINSSFRDSSNKSHGN